MATNRSTGSRSGLIHCNNCGEDYSASYRRCPFCDEYDDYYDQPRNRTERPAQQRSSGGKRLAAPPPKQKTASMNRISLFQVVTILLSLAIILIAFWIVTARLIPLIHLGEVDTIDADSAPSPDRPSNTQTTDPDADPATSPDTGINLILPSIDPAVDPAVDTTEPPPVVSTAPAPGEATSFTMSGNGDVSLYNKGEPWRPRITFYPAGTTADLTWESDNPNIASVTSDGLVTAVGRGTTTISAMMPNGVTQACIVRCNFSDSSSSSSDSGSSSNTSSSYRINNPDFTFYYVGEQYTVKVLNYTGTVTWSSSNTNVVTVDSGGNCVAVANGSCKVTGTLEDGTTVKADVYVRIK